MGPLAAWVPDGSGVSAGCPSTTASACGGSPLSPCGAPLSARMSAGAGNHTLQLRAGSPPSRRGSPRTAALRSMEVVRTAPVFHVGDRVEYWSDTYRQWMPGVVQRVRDGGQLFDLDVKKGAQVSKLRPDRSATGVRGASVPAEPLSAREHQPLASAWCHETAPTVMQAKQISAELSEVTRAIQGQMDWAELSGQDMVSRAGAVTVRKMVETTKALLQGLEGALILRAGFIASCFHMWRCETTLARAGRLYQDEFHRHHNEWNEHVDQVKRHYESELQRLQMVALCRKDRVARQQMLVLDKWVHGDRIGLLREMFRSWCLHAWTQEDLRRRSRTVQVLVAEWTEGSNRGIVHSCYRLWRDLTLQELQVRQHEEERRRNASSVDAQMRTLQQQKDAEMQRLLQEIERKARDRTHSIELVLAKWQRGSAKGLLTAVTQAWLRRVQHARALQPINLVVRKWAMGNDKGLMVSTLKTWSGEARRLLHSRQLSEHQHERKRLEELLADTQKAHRNLAQEHVSMLEKRKREAKALVEFILRKWEMGTSKGTMKEILSLWSAHVREVKTAGSRRQAVHFALLRGFEGEERSGKHITFLNWKQLTISERHDKELQQRQALADAQVRSFLAETQAEQDAKLAALENSQAAIKARAHEASQVAVRKCILGDRKGLLKSVVVVWHMHVANVADRERKRAAVKDALLRSMEGNRRGMLHMTFFEWTAFVKTERARHADVLDADSRVVALEKKVEAMIDKEARKLAKYGEMLGSKQSPVLKQMCFTSWRAECGGLASELEKERERAVAVEELGRQRHMAETLHQELRARVIHSLGCKRSIVLCSVVFEAWSYLWQQRVDAQAQRLNKNEAMLKYSEFVIGQRLKKDRVSLLASTFAEWLREAKILHHQLHHEGTQQQLLESRDFCARLETQNRELQEQLAIYYQQIDHITDTLQKELKTKEEMAIELQRAYRMRRTTGQVATPTGPTPSSIQEPLGAWSRTSSEQTLHDHPSPTGGAAGGSSRGASRRRERAASPGASAPDLEPPGMPQLPFTRLGGNAHVGREVEAGLASAYVDAVIEVDDDNHRGPTWSRGGGSSSQADALFNALDRNHDGVITRAEMREAYKAGRKY
mmetsp:Transcript_133098/g.385027  ORF Transcript_133098/g.385027 Transcript_133098/m.385027 type:complete len:1117 (-) Transcript_133098:120-3470(-)